SKKQEARSKKSECRVKVVIRSSDKRLMRYEAWARKHLSREVIEVIVDTTRKTGVRWRSWYVYFGAVPLSSIRAIEYADPARRAAEAECEANTAAFAYPTKA